MRAYLGFIPLAIALIPGIVTVIRQGLYYRGGWDGHEYVLVAIFAFLLGGVYNFCFLIYLLIDRENSFSPGSLGNSEMAQAGLIGALALAGAQAVLLIIGVIRVVSLYSSSF